MEIIYQPNHSRNLLMLSFDLQLSRNRLGTRFEAHVSNISPPPPPQPPHHRDFTCGPIFSPAQKTKYSRESGSNSGPSTRGWRRWISGWQLLHHFVSWAAASIDRPCPWPCHNGRLATSNSHLRTPLSTLTCYKLLSCDIWLSHPPTLSKRQLSENDSPTFQSNNEVWHAINDWSVLRPYVLVQFSITACPIFRPHCEVGHATMDRPVNPTMTSDCYKLPSR